MEAGERAKPATVNTKLVQKAWMDTMVKPEEITTRKMKAQQKC